MAKLIFYSIEVVLFYWRTINKIQGFGGETLGKEATWETQA
jgi:hypothetical protein